MGAEREDADPALAGGGTDPGLGPRLAKPNGVPSPSPSAPPAAANAAPAGFDALHAALGDKIAPARAVAAESRGRTNATYASARPHAVPAAHVAPDLSAPAVIVTADDTVPGAPPQQMTMPMMNHPPSGPYAVAGPPSSSPMGAAMLSPNTPHAFAVQGVPVRPGQPQLTMRMDARPRRPRTPTVVVRPRGPSAKQKFAVFSIMLLLVSACGIAIVMWRAPQLFGIGVTAAPPRAPAPRIVPAVRPTAALTTTATATATATAAASALPAAPPTATSPAPKKPRAPRKVEPKPDPATY